MKTAVIGAGPAGLAAAYCLAKRGLPVEVYESTDTVGGLAKSFRLWGQTVDLGPHRFFSLNRQVNELWLEVVGDRYRMVQRKTRVFFDGRFFKYPLDPIDIIKNVRLGESFRCLASYLGRHLNRSKVPPTLESWLISRFGKQLYLLFFKRYSEKLWGLPCSEIEADFASQRIGQLSLGKLLSGAICAGHRKGHRSLIDQFAYPVGGTGSVYSEMQRQIQRRTGIFYLSTPVKRLLERDGVVVGLETNNGETRYYDHVISSMPLTRLVSCLPFPTQEAVAAAKALTFRNTIIVYLHVDNTMVFPDNWIYINSSTLRTGRITNFRNWVRELWDGHTTSILAMEYWCSDQDDIWCKSEAELVDYAVRDLLASKCICVPEQILDGTAVKVPKSYPVYRLGYHAHVQTIQKYLAQFVGLQVIGRYGSFKYNNQDHSLYMGILAATNVLEKASHDLWSVNSDFDTYQERSYITGGGLQLTPA